MMTIGQLARETWFAVAEEERDVLIRQNTRLREQIDALVEVCVLAQNELEEMHGLLNVSYDKRGQEIDAFIDEFIPHDESCLERLRVALALVHDGKEGE